MPKRIQRKRTKGWRMPPNTVYVGRPSRWGNPYEVCADTIAAGMVASSTTPAQAVELYRSWLFEGLARWPEVWTDLEDLRGRNLACWCTLGQPCHADVLLELANR